MKGNVQQAKPQQKRKKLAVKDVIIYGLSLVLLGVIVVTSLSGVPVREWGDQIIGIIGDLAIYLLGLVGVFEFGYDNGLTMIVPDNFIDYKEKRQEKQMKQNLYAFFDKETEYLRCHENERLADTLSMMGLSAEGYREVQARTLQARLAPMYDIETARNKLLDLVFYSQCVIDMHKDSDQVNSADLRYYLKIHDLMHNSSQSDLLAKIMATFIRLTCEQEKIDLGNVDVIMVPHSSNFLLGLKVSKLLNKRFIKMIPPDKRVGNHSYEGVVSRRPGTNDVNVLMVHDVLLSGRQIGESAVDLCNTLPNCRILGLFSLIYRNVFDGKGKLENSENIRCYSLAELTEDEITEEIRRRSDAT